MVVLIISMLVSDLRLHHEAALSSQFHDALVHVEGYLSLDGLQQDVQHNECARAPDAGTAVHQQGGGVRGEVVLADEPDKAEQGCGIARDAVVWPRLEVVVGHLAVL